MQAGVPVELISARFHETLADALAKQAALAAERTGVRTVALSGGCFMNLRLLESVISRIAARGLQPIWHHQVPANDGGLSLGQAVIAAAVSRRSG